jgi:Calcineurin-like phosphoesterase superfamily domain
VLCTSFLTELCIFRLRHNIFGTALGCYTWSPGSDDGPGIAPGVSEEQLGQLLAGCGADVVIGGHTHYATDRVVDGIRALNPGSTGLPRSHGIANWLLIEDDGEELAITHRGVPYDAGAVAADLRHRRHPNAEFITSILTGARQL